MWRRRAWGVVLLVLSLMLAACGGGNRAPSGEGTSPQNQPIELLFWEQDDEVIDKVTDELIAEFQQKNQNITVVRTHYTTEDLRSNFQTAALGDAAPHIVYGPNDNIGVFATMGIIQPLDDVFPTEFWASFDASSLDSARFQGKIWGIPDRMGNQLTLLYNKDFVQTPPQTWDELIQVAQSVQKSNKDVYGLVYFLNEPFWLIPFYGGYGGRVMDESNQPTLDNEAMRKALQFVADLKFKHKIVPQECDYNCADSLFKQGKAAFLINGPWSFQGYAEALGEKLGVAVLPKLPDGDYLQPYTATKTYHISAAAAKDPAVLEAVKAFLTFMNSKDAQIRLAKVHKQMPTHKEAAQDPALGSDPLIAGTIAQVAKGTPMPIVPEMRAIWDSIRPHFELVMAGRLQPAEAAKKMQEDALKKIDEMH